MKVSEVLERLKNGENLKAIAEVLGIDSSTLRRKMKGLGYTFDNSTKEWSYSGTDSTEPLEQDVMGMVKTSNRKVSNNSPKVIPSNKKKTESENKVEHRNKIDAFAAEDIADLHEMLAEWRMQRDKQSKYKSLHEEIKALKRENRKRKTVILSEDVANRLDALSDRERFDKSDLLEVALEHFLGEYE
ncbi:ribbon-helix-helix domain-containing protein [Bacillus paranthracis]|uniref:ribbon-helix-helix domain-containing protein n=1 Tax=Bacillus paranthracis TaxID=2026186 RepID=UPI002814630D|nr:ribbon-helix-helix domain-containing protein [Bacillus paranthracis]MDR0171415.1 ribbon-helix-helix domain-containing protein [Bacillus paranthracis]